MNQFVDALGKACPMPVILAKKEIDAGNTSFVVAVDNEVAVQNLQRLAESQGYQAQVQTKDGNFHVSFTGEGASAACCEETAKPKKWALFVGKDFIGFGYTKLLEESNEVLTELRNVVNITTLSMTDKERMDVVERCHSKMKRYRNLVSYYTNKNISVSYLRAKKKNDLDRIMGLYGNMNERYW